MGTAAATALHWYRTALLPHYPTTAARCGAGILFLIKANGDPAL